MTTHIAEEKQAGVHAEHSPGGIAADQPIFDPKTAGLEAFREAAERGRPATDMQAPKPSYSTRN